MSHSLTTRVDSFPRRHGRRPDYSAIGAGRECAAAGTCGAARRPPGRTASAGAAAAAAVVGKMMHALDGVDGRHDGGSET